MRGGGTTSHRAVPPALGPGDEDKRKAVRTLLRDEQWRRWSDREIARRCAVDNSFVTRLRQSLLPSNSNESAAPRTYTTNEQLAAWEAAGEYFPASVRSLRDQTIILEAVIKNSKQRRA
jgi:hypothetical protein